MIKTIKIIVISIVILSIATRITTYRDASAAESGNSWIDTIRTSITDIYTQAITTGKTAKDKYNSTVKILKTAQTSAEVKYQETKKRLETAKKSANATVDSIRELQKQTNIALNSLQSANIALNDAMTNAEAVNTALTGSTPPK